MLLLDGSRPVYRGTPWTGHQVKSEGEYLITNTNAVIISLAFVTNDEESYTMLTVSDGAWLTRCVLAYSGKLQFQSWNSSSSTWVIFGQWPPHECNRYGYCGPNGYCDETALPTPTCKCLDGFDPTSTEEWSNGEFSKGCRRREALHCSDGFFALPGMKPPDSFVRVENTLLEECAEACSRNCSCMAYSYANLSSNIANGDTTRCLVWVGELVDTGKLGASTVSDTLYLRRAGLDATTGTNPPPLLSLYLPMIALLLSRGPASLYEI